MDVTTVKHYVERILSAESESGIDEALISAYAAYLQKAQSPGANGVDSRVQIAALNLIRSGAHLRSLLEDPEGLRAVEFLKIPQFTILLGEDIKNLIEQTTDSPAIISARLNSIRGERQALLQKFLTINLEFDRIGIKPQLPQAGRAELGFLLPRSFFDNSLHDFAAELVYLDEVIEAFSRLATGKAQRASLVSVNTTDPWIFLGIDPATAAQLVHAFQFTINLVKDLATMKQGLDMVRSLFAPKEHEDASDRFAKIVDERVDVRVDDQLRELSDRITPEDANELRPVLSRAYNRLFVEIEGGVRVTVRADMSSDMPPEQLQAFNDLVDSVKQLAFPPPRALNAPQITDTHVSEVG